MAGLGFKDFQVGEVLTSADVDGYLMQQSVMRFADSGARGSALGTAVGTGVPLAEGMVTYLDDVNQVQVFDGTAWATTGKLLQVVTAVDATERTTTSTSFVDASLSVSITPLSASSNLYAFWSGWGSGYRATTDGEQTLRLSITDSSDVALEGAEDVRVMKIRGNLSGVVDGKGPGTSFTVIGKVASGSTSARTYKARFAVQTSANTGTGYLRNDVATGRLTVMEVA